MNTFGLAPLLLIFPLIGVLFNGFVGRRFVMSDRTIGERWSGWFASIMALSSFAVAVTLFFSLVSHGGEAVVVPFFDWIYIPSANFYIPWAFQIDTLSVTMMLVVTGVGSLIHIYAIGYMHGDPHFSRFFNFLNLFLFFMLILVSGSSYLMLFVGWEGVGLCSFLLIGFWFERSDEKGRAMNADAARKAFVANRVGDLAMILAMIVTFWAFGTMEFEPVFETAVELFTSGEMVEIAGLELTVGAVLTAVTALFLVGAAGKSAQIPLFVWLPDAMAGPTPVSALIHAATMVTSGIYLIVRSSVFFEIARESGVQLFNIISSPDLVALIGALTALYAGLVAFTQFDVKKVLAYSTVSQLGFMIAAVGMGAYVAGMFHLVTHAFFKALLFMGSGSIIHGMEHGHHHLAHGHDDHHDDFDPQDMRTMGGLRHKMPQTFWTYLIGSLALAGIFPLAGFWSKDEILAHVTDNGSPIFWAVFIMLGIAAFCTAFYMARQVKMVFFGKPRHEAAEHAHESPWEMTVPLMVLAALATLGGLLNWPKNMPSFGFIEPVALEHWLEHSIGAFHLSEEGIVHLPHTPTSLVWWVAGLSTVIAVGAIALAYFVIYASKPEKADDADPMSRFAPVWFFRHLLFDSFYMKRVIPLFNGVSKWTAFTLDWDFWHDFVHNRIILDFFRGGAGFIGNLDVKGLDGLVVGSGKLTRQLANLLSLSQSGYARSYALSIFLGAVALLAYFLWPVIVG